MFVPQANSSAIQYSEPFPDHSLSSKASRYSANMVHVKKDLAQDLSQLYVY